MILVDANLLLYAYHPRATQHEASRAWLESVLSGSEFVRFAWVSALGVPADLDQPARRSIIRSPRPRRWPPSRRGWISPWPASWSRASVTSKSWLDCSLTVRLPAPLVMDAALAAIAIEHGATLYTTDRDFARFPGLDWINPHRRRAAGPLSVRERAPAYRPPRRRRT